MSLEFPQIDPVAIALGPVQIRWYALSYIVGILLGLFYIKKILKKYSDEKSPTSDDIDDFMTWAILGIVLGGRIGYVLFYNFDYYLSHPSKILHVWEGGMSFHGGFIGVFLAIILFSLKNKINMLRLADLIALAAPVGLFFGRIANFINAELYGRVTDVPWGMVFPNAGDMPRHPSQLYEAFLEGLLLFVILFVCFRCKTIRARAGVTSVIFIVGYALSRMVVEFYREPDAHIGFVLIEFITMGQILSMGMIVGAMALLFIVLRKNNNKTE
ncbi:MAG: prolipoprotein diacylglyceryl transferase [Bdellovibrionales bacterium]